METSAPQSQSGHERAEVPFGRPRGFVWRPAGQRPLPADGTGSTMAGLDGEPVDACTAIRGNEFEWDLAPRAAFDALACIPTVSIWHAPDPFSLIHEP